MPTIDEIARKAGVSISTVSFVINGRPGPSAATVAHVRRVMEEMNYVPSALAQRFASQKSKTIALVVLPYPHVFSDLHHAQALDAVYEVLQAQEYALLLAASDAQFVEQRRHFRMLRSGQVDGMLLLEPTLDQGYLGELASEDAPVVIINSDGDEAGLDYVRTDDVAIGRGAAQHLLELGHRRIGYIAGSANHASARDREAGFLNALAEAGAALPTERLFAGSYDTSYWSGYRGCEQILRSCPETTAIFCCNDTMAFGALEAAQRAGRQVPAQLSLLGVDDNPTSTYSNPPLTTFRQPSHDVARQATETLLQRLTQGGERRAGVGRTLQPSLIVRRSTGPVPSA